MYFGHSSVISSHSPVLTREHELMQYGLNAVRMAVVHAGHVAQVPAAVHAVAPLGPAVRQYSSTAALKLCGKAVRYRLVPITSEQM